MRLLIAITVATITSQMSTDVLMAQSEFMLVHRDRPTWWVAGRDKTNAKNGYVSIVLKIEDDPDMGPRRYVRAKMWGYTRVRTNERHYDGMERVTPDAMWLKGEIQLVGTGRNKREELTLTRGDDKVTVWLTATVQRSKRKVSDLTKEIVLCRWKDERRGKGPRMPCEDPPTEDILEEETGVDPEAMTEAMDPEYYP